MRSPMRMKERKKVSTDGSKSLASRIFLQTLCAHFINNEPIIQIRIAPISLGISASTMLPIWSINLSALNDILSS
jgi:hypothetical protein